MTGRYKSQEKRGRICVVLGECKLGPVDPEELPWKLRESCLWLVAVVQCFKFLIKFNFA